jgi:NADH-quinone oxidoreductase subunit N
MSAIIFTAFFGLILLFAGITHGDKQNIVKLAIAGIFVALCLNIYELIGVGEGYTLFGGMLMINKFGLLFNCIVLFSTCFYFMISGKDFIKVGEHLAEYFALISFILCGICMTSSFGNMLILFLAIEIMSIPQYILAGTDKRNLKSNEASLKYFLMGSFSTGFLLLGITLIYGTTGTFDINAMQLGTTALDPLVLSGIVLLVFSFAFKVSAAPFHFWTPDVYDGSPTVFTSFMATVVKVAGFVAFIRMFSISFNVISVNTQWMTVLSIITAATLIIGNFTAVYQQNVKRMLAYSSIAQAGFMLFAVIALNQLAMEGILLYAAAYCIATIGIFAILLKMKDYTFEGFNGLSKTQPVLAFSNTIFLFSLAGIPLTGGFFAKYFVLSAAVENGQFMWLVIVAVLCAAISAYYYFRIVIAMYFKEGNAETSEIISPAFKQLLIFAVVLIILLGVFPGVLLGWM